MGAPCDDGNPQTIDDIEDGNCNCAGTLGGSGCHPDYDALMAIYNATGGPGWTNMVDWGTSCDVCDWTNVECNAMGRVNNLILQFDLVGAIPGELGNLTELEVLRIFNNQVTSLPSTIGDLSKLTYLEVAFEPLITNIPPEIGMLTELETLYFDYINGTIIPPELGNCTKLKLLCLEGSTLAGNIPSSFENLANLEILNLYGNDLTGPIPCYFGNITTFTEFILAENNFTGCIPSFLFWLFVDQVFVDLSNNPGLQDFSDFCAGKQCVEDVNLISTTSDTALCHAESITLTAAPSLQYTWSTGQSTPSIVVEVYSDTTISVSLLQPDGCIKSDFIELTVCFLPRPLLVKLQVPQIAHLWMVPSI